MEEDKMLLTQETSEATDSADTLEITAAPAKRAGISIGGDTVVKATEHLPETQRALVRWLYEYAKSQGWDWEETERMSKLSTTTLWRIWNDQYRDPKTMQRTADGKPIRSTGDRVPLDGVCEKIARLKKLVQQREGLKAKTFMENTVWQRVSWLCERAFIRQKIGFIYGESQIGKTECLNEYQRRNNHGQTIYVELPPSCGLRLMVQTIAEALHVSGKSCYEELIRRIIAALDESKLLILDEVHRIFTTYDKKSVMRAMDVIRYIHDRSKCGLVLSGTNVFRDNMRSGEFFQYMKQLNRRGLYTLQLPAFPPQEDLDLVARRFGLDPAEGEAEKILDHIAREGFGVVITRLTDAAEIAAKKKQPISWDHFLKAVDIVRKMAGEE